MIINTRNRVFTLIDANNFYVQCHRTFEPGLVGVPVVVQSNNDANAISRSAEAKALGIKMGALLHDIQHHAKNDRLVIRSSNYPLYSDMSNRMASIIADYAPAVEVYSIDESFLELTGVPGDHELRIRELIAKIYKWINLPCCGGTASSKTLAKAANRYAKKHPETNGVCDFTKLLPAEVDQILQGMDIKDVWGIGNQLSERMRNLGIYTALDLKNADLQFIKQQFSLVEMRLVQELNGISCIALEEVTPDRKQIRSSRSFGRPVLDKASVQSAVATFVATAGAKLRGQDSFASTMIVSVGTNPFNQDPRYFKSLAYALPAPTANDRDLLDAAMACLDVLYIPGFKYKSASVMLDGIVPRGGQQMDLLSSLAQDVRSDRRQEALDSVKKKFGKLAVRSAAALPVPGGKHAWRMKQDHLSPEFTTDWAGIIKAH